MSKIGSKMDKVTIIRMICIIIFIASLIMIWYGAYKIYPPAAWISVGLLIYIDLHINTGAGKP